MEQAQLLETVNCEHSDSNPELHRLFTRDQRSQKALQDVLPHEYQLFTQYWGDNPAANIQRQNALIVGLQCLGYDVEFVPPMTREYDCLFAKQPLSVKISTTGEAKNRSVTLSWVSNYKAQMQFIETYKPSCDILLCHYNPDADRLGYNNGALYYITLAIQLEEFDAANGEYLIQPREEGDPRGVKISKDSLGYMLEDALSIPIKWYWKDCIVHRCYEPMASHKQPFIAYLNNQGEE